MSPDHPMMNADNVSKWLRISKSTLCALCKDGQVPAVRIGKHWRFERGVLQHWLVEKSRERTANGG
jgi:excisionase family DNA binding protein